MVRMAFDYQVSEICQGEPSPRRRQLLGMNQPPKYLRHLDIDEMRRVNPLRRIECASSNPLRPGRLQDQLYGR